MSGTPPVHTTGIRISSLPCIHPCLRQTPPSSTHNRRSRRCILHSTFRLRRSRDYTGYLPRTASHSSCCQRNPDIRTCSSAAGTMCRLPAVCRAASGTAYCPAPGAPPLSRAPAQSHYCQSLNLPMHCRNTRVRLCPGFPPVH